MPLIKFKRCLVSGSDAQQLQGQAVGHILFQKTRPVDTFATILNLQKIILELRLDRFFYLDTVAIMISTVLLLLYYVFLAYRVRATPAYTIHAINDKARLLWVLDVMENRGKDVMAVQTLRNFTMAATFKASSAILLIMGTLTLSGQADSMAKTWHVLSIAGSSGPEWWIIKIMALLTVLIVAFFAFALAIRLMNHVVFMINLPKAGAQGILAPEQVAQRLNQAGVFYRIGMRAFFIAVPLAFWLFGSVFLIASTLGLIGVLYFLDRNPLS